MAGKRQSGNPATRAQNAQTAEQQREQRRREKLAEHEKSLARRRRTGVLWWVVGSVAALTVAGVVAASFAFAPRAVEYTAFSSTGATIDGVETFQNKTQHVEGTVDYPQSPPAGGPHNQYWLNCGVYDQPQPNEYAVHSLEHGTVWITYDPALIRGDDLETLKGYLPSSYALLSPYEGMDTPIAVSAWNAQLKLDSVDDPRITEFFTEYWRSQNVPEPNAVCSGAIEGEGRV